jgi:hypothetical protein
VRRNSTRMSPTSMVPPQATHRSAVSCGRRAGRRPGPARPARPTQAPGQETKPAVAGGIPAVLPGRPAGWRLPGALLDGLANSSPYPTKLAWTSAPRWLGWTVYLALGWVAVVATPQLFARLGVAGGLLIVAGGLIYSAGAGRVRPAPPRPGTGCLRLPRGLSSAGRRWGHRPLPGHQPVRAAHRLNASVGGSAPLPRPPTAPGRRDAARPRRR